jgi:hypothetical protein
LGEDNTAKNPWQERTKETQEGLEIKSIELGLTLDILYRDWTSKYMNICQMNGMITACEPISDGDGSWAIVGTQVSFHFFNPRCLFVQQLIRYMQSCKFHQGFLMSCFHS